MQELEKKIYQSEKLEQGIEYFLIPSSNKVITLLAKSEDEPEIDNVLIFDNISKFREWTNDLEEY